VGVFAVSGGLSMATKMTRVVFEGKNYLRAVL
jgi:hypothetical protein